MPLNLVFGQAYYIGRLKFQEVVVYTDSAPKVLSNCTHIISKARGMKSNECCDGEGVDIESVRSALSVTKEQLLYLPLKI